MGQRITSKSLAQELGLAQSTVSMALRNHPSINPQTRERVQEVARRLNYTFNGMARAMATGKSRVIAMVLGFGLHEHSARTLSGIMRQANEHGYFIKLMGIDEAGGAHHVVTTCMELCISAIICHSVLEKDLKIIREAMREQRIPMTAIDFGDMSQWGIYLASEDTQGASNVVRHLVALGHRKIGFIGGPNHSETAVKRQAGYQVGLAEAEIAFDPHLVVNGEFDTAITEKVARELLDQPNRPTAVFCATDYMALVVLRVARHLKLDVPADLSLAGYADLQFAEMTDPPLTTVRQPFEDLGTLAVRRLVEVIDQGRPEDHWTEVMTLPTELIIRQSTAAPSC